MDTNKNYQHSNISINTILTEEELNATNSIEEIEIIEEAIEIELQDTDSTKNGLVLSQESSNKKSKALDLKQVLLSLKYALSWSQFKRQLNKEALVAIAQRHAKKVAVGAAILLLYLSFGGTNQNPPNNQPEYVYTTANIVNLGAQSQGLVVSDYAKENYIARFSDVAQKEGQKYDIPPSIILALAIANSNFGSHTLAQEGHNHFQIKCSQNPLTEGLTGQQDIEGTCFSQYQNAWTSFRANSLLLTSPIFEELHAIAKNDYHIWASGLEKMKYPNAEKLNSIIEEYELAEFDKTTTLTEQE